MLQDTPDNYLIQVEKFPFKLYKVQKFIISQLDNSFKVISLPRKCGVTTSVSLCGIIRLTHGLDTDLISRDRDELLYKTIDLIKIFGIDVKPTGYDIGNIHIRSEYLGNYSIFDTPFEECKISNSGIALDCYGKWNYENKAKVTWQVI